MISRSDNGYVLTEVLVAGAIAAAVTVAALSGVAQSLRASRNAAEVQMALIEAENIADRLRAGLDVISTAELYPGWEIELRPANRPVDPTTGAVMTAARISHPEFPQAGLQLLFVESGSLNTPGRE